MKETVKRFNHWHEVEDYLGSKTEQIIYFLGDSNGKNEIILSRNMVNRGDPDWDFLVTWRDNYEPILVVSKE